MSYLAWLEEPFGKAGIWVGYLSVAVCRSLSTDACMYACVLDKAPFVLTFNCPVDRTGPESHQTEDSSGSLNFFLCLYANLTDEI